VIEHIWQLGNKLIDGFNAIVARHDMGERIGIIGYPPKTVVTFTVGDGQDDLLLKSAVQKEMIQRGSLYAGYHVISYSHTHKEIEKLLADYDATFSLLKPFTSREALRRHLGTEPVKPVFR
jgi:glutamate-1-semialdehyde 2,1-aminomutase